MIRLNVTGKVIHYETDLKTGKIIEGTYVEDHNTIYDDLKKRIAQAIGDSGTGLYLDPLFDTQGDLSTAGPANDGKSGIYYGTELNSPNNFFVTTKNAGGDGYETYVEFYGYIDGPLTMNGYLFLARNFDYDAVEFEVGYAQYSISKTVAENRRYHFYWKITIS